MTAIMKTREERREELKQLAAMPNGIDQLYSILSRNFIRFDKLPEVLSIVVDEDSLRRRPLASLHR
jgi:hypothetical protein